MMMMMQFSDEGSELISAAVTHAVSGWRRSDWARFCLISEATAAKDNLVLKTEPLMIFMDQKVLEQHRSTWYRIEPAVTV